MGWHTLRKISSEIRNQSLWNKKTDTSFSTSNEYIQHGLDLGAYFNLVLNVFTFYGFTISVSLILSFLRKNNY